MFVEPPFPEPLRRSTDKPGSGAGVAAMSSGAASAEFEIEKAGKSKTRAVHCPSVGGQSAIVRHLEEHLEAVSQLRDLGERLQAWGATLARQLEDGSRLLVAGNGGSAAQAQHLAAELVGHYRCDRQALSVIALHAETSSLSALANDFGWEHAYARQVEAHGRPGDVLLLLSTSGESANLLAAAHAARASQLRSWAMTGPSPNQLERVVEQAIAIQGAGPAVQEAHLVAIHMLCAAIDSALVGSRRQG